MAEEQRYSCECPACQSIIYVLGNEGTIQCWRCSKEIVTKEHMKLTLDEAKALGNRFATELGEEFKTKLIWWFVGSIKAERYIAGKSDIDMVIIPAEKGMFGVEGIKHMLAKMEDYKKYGMVFKKGRMISLIDAVVFLDLTIVNNLRLMHNAKT
jgi:hypothetical protein